MKRDNSARPHILVADDDRLVLACLAQGLREAGYEVSEASNGRDAFDLARSRHPDLALLDVNMPGMSGIEVGALLHQHTDVPFLYLSAYGQSDIVQDAIERGALGYLVKPLDVSQILPSIEAALARAADLIHLRETETHLNTALAGSRDVSIAVGVLMERNRLDQQEGFEVLRNRARMQRRKVQDVAKDMIDAVETINHIKPAQQAKTDS